MQETKNKSFFIIMLCLILWIIYICEEEMSTYGIYTTFSYDVHEVLSVVPYLCIFVTICLLVVIIAKTIKKTDIKTNLYLGMFVFFMFVAQIFYIKHESETVSTYTFASIQSVNEEKQELTFSNTEGDKMTLYYPMLVQGLIKTDGTEYLIDYEWNKTNPNYGKLCMIQSTEE